LTDILVAIFAYNEGERIKRVLARHPKNRNYDLLVVDDGSTDGSLNSLPPNVLIMKNKKNMGIGYAMKRMFKFALNKKYDVIVIQAGNDKDDPLQIPALIKPIVNDKADFVQGSRFLKGGAYGNMPTYRVFATKVVHPTMTSIVAGKRLTESTNGFRAFSPVILKDRNIDWRQEWLDSYQLEPYLLIKTIREGYRHMEVPCTKIYPSKKTTKMNIKDWWHIMSPIFYLGLGIKK